MASVNETVSFKLDTGAEVTAVSEETFKMVPETPLKQPEKKLFGSSHQISQASFCIHTWVIPTYVVRGLRFGLPAWSPSLVSQLVQRLNLL